MREEQLLPKVYTAKWTDLSILTEMEARSTKEDLMLPLYVPGDAGSDFLFTQPLSSEKFAEYLRNPEKGLLMIIKSQTEIPGKEVLVGYLAFRTFDQQNYIDSIHIWKSFRRKSYGRFLLQKALDLPDRFSEYKRKVTTCSVRESDLVAQLFLRSCGLRAEKIMKNFYDLPKEDAYIFRYRRNSSR